LRGLPILPSAASGGRNVSGCSWCAATGTSIASWVPGGQAHDTAAPGLLQPCQCSGLAAFSVYLPTRLAVPDGTPPRGPMRRSVVLQASRVCCMLPRLRWGGEACLAVSWSEWRAHAAGSNRSASFGCWDFVACVRAVYRLAFIELRGCPRCRPGPSLHVSTTEPSRLLLDAACSHGFHRCRPLAESVLWNGCIVCVQVCRVPGSFQKAALSA
jgi:hypothetical protein